MRPQSGCLSPLQLAGALLKLASCLRYPEFANLWQLDIQHNDLELAWFQHTNSIRTICNGDNVDESEPCATRFRNRSSETPPQSLDR